MLKERFRNIARTLHFMIATTACAVNFEPSFIWIGLTAFIFLCGYNVWSALGGGPVYMSLGGLSMKDSRGDVRLAWILTLAISFAVPIYFLFLH